jgi:hypothetical protein
VVRVVIVRPWRHHYVSLPLAYAPDDLLTHMQKGKQFAIVVVKDFVFVNAEAFSSLDRFRAAPFGERSAALILVPGVTVRNRDELHMVSHGCKDRTCATCPNVTVIGVRPESYHSKIACLSGHQARNEDQQKI